ncbi:MAG TPA: chemotaxis protein CheW [Luteitalea sp.]|nr:chemotaxis protein CheW [Luteitalea sp.]
MSQNDNTTATPAATKNLAGKYLTFALSREEYGLPVLKVREIIKMMDITAVPQVPAAIRGVMNLRGKVIPVIDLRIRFGLPAQEDTDRSSIIVVDLLAGGDRVLMGVVVDAVRDVLNITEQEIQDPPQFGTEVATDFMTGLAKVKGTVKILLDLDVLFRDDAAAMVERAA